MKTKQLFISLLSLVVILSGISLADAAGVWNNPKGNPPTNNTDAPINVGTIAQDKAGVLRVTGFRSFFDAIIDTKLQVGTTGTMPSNLKLLVDGKVGAEAYCDRQGNNCVTSSGIAVSSNTNNNSSSTNSNSNSSCVWDSGWVDTGNSWDKNMTFTHNLGTNDTVVFIQYKPRRNYGSLNGDGSSSGAPIHKAGESHEYLAGFYSEWYNKNNTQISFVRYGLYGNEFVRIVLKKISCL
jgi:hypothetical protein